MTQDSTYYTIMPPFLPADDSVETDTGVNESVLVCYDSLFASYTSDTVVARPSMFTAQQWPADEKTFTQHNNHTGTDWLFGTAVLLLILMSIHLNSRKYKIKDILQSMFDIRVLERVTRESNIKSLSMLPMSAIYIADIALIAMRWIQTYKPLMIYIAEPLFYLLLFATSFFFFLVRNGLIRTIGNIFQDYSATALYISSNHLFYYIGSLVVTPMLLFVLFGGNLSTIALYIATAIPLIILIVRFLRGLQLILTNSETSKLYLFYYLCILEIVPFLIIIKVILP